MSNRGQHWMILGLGVLASIAGGILVGQQASADMAPFYANLSTTMPHERQSDGVEIVSSEGSSSWVETPNLGFRNASSDDMQDGGY